MKPPTLIMFLIMAFLGGVAAYVVSVVRHAEPAPQHDIYAGVPVDAKLLELDKRALDESYHTHLIKLWGVWLADGGGDSTRITKGLQNARRAYYNAAEQIAKRERELGK